MGKDEAVRLTDTIDFIRTATVPTAHNAARATVAGLLRARYDADRIRFNVSPAMSQGSNYTIFGRDQVKENRHYRRAIILIRMALQNCNHSIAPVEASHVSDDNLPAELGNYLNQITTALQDLATKLALLKSNPLSFLSNNTFNMIGSSTSAPMQYEFFHDPLANSIMRGRLGRTETRQQCRSTFFS